MTSSSTATSSARSGRTATSSAPSRGAAEAVVVDPGGDAAELRLELARAGRALRGDPDHARPLGPPRRRRRPRRGHRRAGLHGRGRAGAAREPARTSSRPACPRARTRRTCSSPAARRSSSPGISLRDAPRPRPLAGHLAYYADGCLFSGDVLFAGSVGRTDLPGADWDTLLDSIRALVDRFPPETVVYPGHGPPTTLGAELARNPFLARAARLVTRFEAPRGTHDILPAEQPLWRLVDRRGGAALRALRLPADPDAGLRGHRALRAHVRRRARTSSRRRCTRSRTAAAAR